MKRKLMSFLLVLCLLCSIMPTALAIQPSAVIIDDAPPAVTVKEDGEEPIIKTRSVKLASKMTTYVGDRQEFLQYEIIPADATNQFLTWKSSNSSVLRIDSNTGVMTARKKGTAYVTATTRDTKKRSNRCKVTVKPQPVADVLLSANSITGRPGEKVSLTATVYPENAGNKNVTWTTSAKAVTTYNTKYKRVELKANGDAVITVKTKDGGFTKTCKIHVQSESAPIVATQISVSPNDVTLDVGGTRQLAATVSPSDAADKSVTWSSGNASVASVSATGLVTAKASGTTTIEARTNNGLRDTCTINVKQQTLS